MKRLTMCVVAALAAVTFGAAGPRSAEARMQYFQAFEKKYDKVQGVADTKCAICHGGDKGVNKKQISDYGKELGTALGGKNVKDPDKIKSALEAIEKKDAGDGKTFGDILKDGKLPPAFKS
jgi:hypothetical protein